jgi:hypothetical protein
MGIHTTNQNLFYGTPSPEANAFNIVVPFEFAT